jgi:hypothetical protein
VIISFAHNLLFLKVPKTGSSSVEGWLADMAFGGSGAAFIEGEEHLPFADERGLVTRMGNLSAGEGEIKPHISLTGVRTLVGSKTFSRLTAVATVRNPFDQIVSLFWWSTARNKPELYRDLLVANPRVVAKAFKRFVTSRPRNPWFRQRNWLVTDDRQDEANRVLRFETLEQDIDDLKSVFFSKENGKALPKFKHNLSREDIDSRSIFDSSTRRLVEEMMDWECERFSYRF